MITAEFFGGPRDGERIALNDPRPLRIPIAPDMSSTFVQYADQPIRSDVSYIEILPRRRLDGVWMLPWREAA